MTLNAHLRVPLFNTLAAHFGPPSASQGGADNHKNSWWKSAPPTYSLPED